MPKGLKDYNWTVIICERKVGFPNFYWKAFNDNPDSGLKFQNDGPFSSERSAQENFRDFAKVEGIKNYFYPK